MDVQNEVSNEICANRHHLNLFQDFDKIKDFLVKFFMILTELCMVYDSFNSDLKMTAIFILSTIKWLCDD